MKRSCILTVCGIVVLLGALWTFVHLYSIVSLDEAGILLLARADVKLEFSPGPAPESALSERVDNQKDWLLSSWKKGLLMQVVQKGGLALLLAVTGLMILGTVGVWRPLVLITAILMSLGTIVFYRSWMFWMEGLPIYDYCDLPFQKAASYGSFMMLPVLTIACVIAFLKLKGKVSDEPSVPSSQLGLG